jgi:hypothetical protein
MINISKFLGELASIVLQIVHPHDLVPQILQNTPIYVSCDILIERHSYYWKAMSAILENGRHWHMQHFISTRQVDSYSTYPTLQGPYNQTSPPPGGNRVYTQPKVYNNVATSNNKTTTITINIR